jgi:hypothetical protein
MECRGLSLAPEKGVHMLSLRCLDVFELFIVKVIK